jgi:hypothetical protein
VQGGALAIGMRPAFARPPGTVWQATVRVTFLRAEPIALALPGGATAARLTLRAGETVGLQFSPAPADSDVPADFAPVVEVIAAPEEGPPARRRGVAPVGAGQDAGGGR